MRTASETGWRLLQPGRKPARRTIVILVGLVLCVSVGWLVFTSGPASAADPCGPPVVSVIACENALPGDPPSDWQVSGSGDSTIQGYATTISANPGETVSFKINTTAKSYHIDILRMGYYQGNGARIVQAGLLPTASLPQNQPSCVTDSTTGLVDCGNWGVSASWTVPASAVSGVYLAHLVRNDTGGDSLIPFVVRNDAGSSQMLFQTSDTTWQAYNTYGGNSLYQCTVACPPGNPGGYKGAYKVSYNRPFNNGSNSAPNWLMYAEYPMIRFLEANGYDVSYTSGLDVATRGSLLTNHKAFLSVGHDEYWSGDQRANVESARDHGVNLDFFSGNEVFWKTRWEPSIASGSAPGRTLVTYKETHFDGPADPSDPPTWTGTWRDPRFSPPGDGGQAENALTGQFFLVNSGTTDIQVPAQYGKLRFWRNTAVANLTSGQTLTLGSGAGTLGYEWDEDVDNGFRPAGIVNMSSTTLAAEAFVDYGTNVAQGVPVTHKLTLYRAPSGALVFGAGTVQWSWGLDGATTGHVPDRNMQQATLNLFADQGVQPYAAISGLTAAASSADTAAPSSSITAPAGGASLGDGAKLTITGTASDTGGVLAGVEVSTDGGATWHPATGTNTWSYSWVAHGSPTATIRTRAVDDSGNMETPTPGVTVNISCPCSLWGNNVTPALADSGDTSGVELGMKFKADTDGAITAVRFYKSTKNTGTHVGNLWTAAGQLLARGTFTNETGSGWQQLNFSSPVPITANTTYVASYYTPVGHYAQGEGYMYPHPAPEPDGNNSLDSAPLHALRNTVTSPNGLYSYSGSTTFPVSTYKAENYWVDVVYASTTKSEPAAPTNVTATAGDASATVDWTAPSDGGSTITSYIITPYIGTTAQTPTTITGNPPATKATISGLTNGTTYTFTVKATNAIGTGPASSPSNAITPARLAVPGTPTNVSATPANRSATVDWTAPSDGGSTITSYIITPYIGTTAQTPTTITGNPPATKATIKGLKNGTTYTFTVKATNAIGTGPASTASNPVTPAPH
jgi:hypothetical protein